MQPSIKRCESLPHIDPLEELKYLSAFLVLGRSVRVTMKRSETWADMHACFLSRDLCVHAPKCAGLTTRLICMRASTLPQKCTNTYTHHHTPSTSITWSSTRAHARVHAHTHKYTHAHTCAHMCTRCACAYTDETSTPSLASSMPTLR
jgi:hypothetical protein